jgi:hypothetical protein
MQKEDRISVWKEIATDILFGVDGKNCKLSSILNRGFRFRKDKGPKDIAEAVQKGIKQGQGRTEYEIEAVASNLRSVFTNLKNNKEEKV